MGERSFLKSWGLRASVSFSPLPLPLHSLFLLSSQLSRGSLVEGFAKQASNIEMNFSYANKTHFHFSLVQQHPTPHLPASVL